MTDEMAIVLLSGGMDSATVLGIAARECKQLAVIHFDYGQRNREKERSAFLALADHYHIGQKLIIPIDFLKTIGGSALTDENIEIPDFLPEKGEIPKSYVPFRNGIMLSMAAAWAETIGAKRIYAGFVEEDSSGYPDCREEFIIDMERAINSGRKPESKLKIIAPLLHMKKSDIIRLGVVLEVPYNHTWSCYHGGEYQCGKCPACRLRKNAFKQAGIIDPVGYNS